MATYEVSGPDGHKYRVTGPDGATDEQVLGQIEAYTKQQPQLTGKAQIPDSKPMEQGPAEPGMFDRMGAGIKSAGRTALSMLTPGGMAKGMTGLGETGLALATGAAAPAAGVIRQAQAGQLGDPDATRRASQTTGYQPVTPQGQATTRTIGELGAKVPGAEYMPAMAGLAGELSMLGRAVPAVGRAARDTVADARSAAGALSRGTPPLPPTGAGAGRGTGGGLLDTLRGKPAAAARTEAAATMRQTLIEQSANELQAETQRLAAKKQELTAQAQQHAQQQSASMGQAHEYESRAAQMQRDIDAQHAQAQRDAEMKHAAAVKAAEEQHAAVTEQSEALGKQVEGKLSEATTHEQAMSATQAKLDAIATSGTLPDLGKQGDVLREGYNKALDLGQKNRETVTKPLYAEGDKAALERERDGARADVSPVLADAKKLLEKAENIPDLAAQLKKLIGSVEGTPDKSVGAPVGKGKVAGKMVKPKPTEPLEGLTIAQLRIANQKLKDIAYSGEIQGYDGILRKEALDMSHKLDTAINKFVPEFEKANTTYREMSEALATNKTRIGKLIAGEEGGLSGDMWSKTPSQKLPDAIFKSREGIDLLTDALAGGPSVTGEARKAAKRQVNDMVEQWILTSVRGADGTYGTKALGKLRAPQTAAALSAVPKVVKRVTKTFRDEAAQEGEVAAAAERAKAARGEAGELSKVRAPLERQAAAGPEKVAPPKVEKPDTAKAEQSMSELSAAAKESRKSAETSAEAKAKVEGKAEELANQPVTNAVLKRLEETLKDADVLGQSTTPRLQKQALDEYFKTLRLMSRTGRLPPDKLRAALAMIDRAEGLQAKTDRAKSIAWKVAGVLGVATAADVGIKLVP